MGVSAVRLACTTISSFFIMLPACVVAASDLSSYAIGGKHFDANDTPTYQIEEDGRSDWYTASGHAAYRETCQPCHGARGTGTDYGVPLADAAILSRYFDFTDTTVNGQIITKGQQTRIMPAFGTNEEVICRLDAIYIYLRAEAAGVLPAVPPESSGDRQETAIAELALCLGK